MDIERVRRLDNECLSMIEYVAQNPDLRPMEIANGVDMESKYVYARLQRIVKAGVFDHKPSPESLISDAKTRLYFLANGVSLESIRLIREAGELKLAEVVSTALAQPTYAVEELNGLTANESVRLLMQKQNGFNSLAAGRINEIVLALRNTNSALDGALVQQQHFHSDIEELRSLVVQQGKALEQALETIDYLLGVGLEAQEQVSWQDSEPQSEEALLYESLDTDEFLDEPSDEFAESSENTPVAKPSAHLLASSLNSIPEFNNNWSEALQLRWFDTVLALFDQRERSANDNA